MGGAAAKTETLPMTDVQLYFAMGLPTFTIMLSFLTQWFGTRELRKEMRDDIREVRDALRSMRTAIEMLTGKLGEVDTRLSVLEDRFSRG
jgi:hypothetical protein